MSKIEKGAFHSTIAERDCGEILVISGCNGGPERERETETEQRERQRETKRGRERDREREIIFCSVYLSLPPII